MFIRTEGDDLVAPISSEDYVKVLASRRAAYESARKRTGPLLRYPTLLEWFVRDEDVQYVVLPEPVAQPKRTPKPRVYRTAESIRAELEKTTAERDAIGSGDIPDRAAANLSPHARSKAAARAGRRRFDRMDRDLERYVQLSKRIDALAARLAQAEVREHEDEVRRAACEYLEANPRASFACLAEHLAYEKDLRVTARMVSRLLQEHRAA